MSRSCYAALVALAASVLAHGPALAQERTGGSTSPRAAIYGVPAQNKGLYFGWRGAADTDIQFSQFFDADHTLTAWFMPQYNAAYPGALFAENGTGRYHVGFGDYSSGDKQYKDKYVAGNPVFQVEVGSSKVLYLVPELTEGQVGPSGRRAPLGHHLAVPERRPQDAGQNRQGRQDDAAGAGDHAFGQLHG